MSVELFNVKKTLKIRKILKVTAKLEVMKNLKKWNLNSSEDYGPRLWSPDLYPIELCFKMMDLVSWPVHTRGQSALEVYVRTSGHEIYFGKKIQ